MIGSRFRFVHLAGFSEAEYELYDLSRKSRDEVEEYISGSQMWNVICPALNDARYRRLVDDKWVFARLASSAELPSPRTLGLFEPRFGRTWAASPLRSGADMRAVLDDERPTGLVAKPVAGRLGGGVMFCEVPPDGEVALVLRGRPITPEVFADRLTGESAGTGGFVLQERLDQHPMLAEINPDTFNVLRVQTFLGGDGIVKIDRAVARFGRRGDEVPLLMRGGVGVAVEDLATGRLGKGVTKPEYGTERLRVHPDSGVELTGRRIPHWDEVLDLCGRAARAVPWLRSIGWDVGLTHDGAVLLEGNSGWDPTIVQAHGRGYLTPALKRELAALGVEAPEAAPTLAQVRRRLARRMRHVLRRRIAL